MTVIAEFQKFQLVVHVLRILYCDDTNNVRVLSTALFSCHFRVSIAYFLCASMEPVALVLQAFFFFFFFFLLAFHALEVLPKCWKLCFLYKKNSYCLFFSSQSAGLEHQCSSQDASLFWSFRHPLKNWAFCNVKLWVAWRTWVRRILNRPQIMYTCCLLRFCFINSESMVFCKM